MKEYRIICDREWLTENDELITERGVAPIGVTGAYNYVIFKSISEAQNGIRSAFTSGLKRIEMEIDMRERFPHKREKRLIGQTCYRLIEREVSDWREVRG